MIDPISALSALQPTLASPTAPGAAATSTASADFGQIMNQISGDAVGSLRTAEATSIQGIQGTASTQQVVESIMSAQRSLQSTLAVRDKIVSAYQEISRMAI